MIGLNDWLTRSLRIKLSLVSSVSLYFIVIAIFFHIPNNVYSNHDYVQGNGVGNAGSRFTSFASCMDGFKFFDESTILFSANANNKQNDDNANKGSWQV